MFRLIVRAALWGLVLSLISAALALANAPATDDLAYISIISGQFQAYRFDAARGLAVPLRTGNTAAVRLAWSPDGTQMALTLCGRRSPEDFRRCSIYLANAVGGDRRLLVEDALAFGWSPDGRSLLFSGLYPNSTLYSVDIATGQQVALSEFDANTSTPSWSPDGRSIVLTLRDIQPARLPAPRLFRASGHDLVALTDHALGDFDPVWSPDASQIAFSTMGFMSSRLDVYVVDVEGGNLRQLTDSGDAYYPVWSPDGRQIVCIQNNQLHRYTLGSPTPEILSSHAAPFAAVWAGDNLYFVGADLRLYRLTLSTGEAHPVSTHPLFWPNQGGRVIQLRPDL
jgi:Tol biopolymer transport system component